MSAGDNLSGDQFETLYHLTDKAKFKPNPRQVPRDNTIAITQRDQPGLYLTANPESWINGHGYTRPFVAEVKVPKGLAERGRWGGERFLPSEHLPQAHVSRVIPIDEHARETYHEPGWVERHHGTSHDGREIQTGAWGHTDFKEKLPDDYRYSGPDVREMSKDEIALHKSRTRAFGKARLKEQGL